MDRSSGAPDVLAQPTRARLFARLVELQRPAGTDELARELELHPNGVRTHLEQLCDAGLVTRARERRPQGRPRDTWSVSEDAQPDPPTAYATLSRWLVRSISDRQDVETTGRRIGRELAGGVGAGADEPRLRRALATLGFRPARDIDAAGTLTYTLANCPYRDAVRENQPVVCALHRGLTRGLLDEISPGTELASFVPKDPYTAGCKIELRGRLAREAAADEPAGDA